MDILTFISIIVVALVVGFVAMVYIIAKTEYAKVTEENEELKKQIAKLKERKVKKEYRSVKNVK